MNDTKLYKKLVARQFSRDFRAATEVATEPIPTPEANQIVVRNLYAGVNASDVNITAGVYFADANTPFDLGVEALGEITAVGENVTHLKVGDHVLTGLLGGGYREYFALDAAMAIPVPEATPEIMTLIVSALTASIGLRVVGEMKDGHTDTPEVVLVTAAAGGTGQYVVQIAKQAGHHVIGTCSTDEKVEYLRSIGCDRPINYKKEDLHEVLKAEYPNGVNLVFESVGGAIFDACVDNLAKHGRLVICGFISEYTSGTQTVTAPRIYHKLLWQSATVRGFLFSDFVEHVPAHVQMVMEDYFAGKLTATVDPEPFVGIEAIADAVEYMHAGKNCGKVVIRY